MPSDARFYEKQGSGGGLEVYVTWITPEYLQAQGQTPTAEKERGLRENLTFEISLSTHSDDVSGFDKAGAARLEVNGRDAGPATWELVDPDLHHAAGLLRFAAGHEPIKELTLTIANLRGVARRAFTWQLP